MKPSDLKTDWQRYYAHPYPLSGITRRILGRNISRAITRFLPDKTGLTIAELGGANSSVYPILSADLSPAEYHIIDKHPTKSGRLSGSALRYHERDILDFKNLPQVDLTLSVGLIEHFSPGDTKKAVLAHMNILKPGGISVMTFPTPTWLYKISRRLSEQTGSWIFHDERPLAIKEVALIAQEHGTVLNSKIVWPIVFTQAILVIKKFPG